MQTNRISGSDVASILGYNKYKSSFQVWMEKTGISQKEIEDIDLKFDRVIKDVILNCWQADANSIAGHTPYIHHEQNSFIVCAPHPSYIQDGKAGALELGSSHKYFDSSDLKYMLYYSKLQLCMGLLKLEIGEIVVLNLIEKELYRYPCNFDPDFYDHMIEKCVNFWESYVIKNIPPPPQSIMDVKTFYTKHIAGDFLDATHEQAKDIERLKVIKAEIKQLESQEKNIQDRVMIDLKDKEGLTYEDKVLCTWKASKESTKFDVDSFKDSHPNLFSQFQKISPGSRRFSVK
jgi:predicted phage-related endonuclease